MCSLRKALLLGLLVWLVPFAVAFCVFPLKTSWRSLFESIMPVTLAAVVTVCALLYFRRATAASVREGLLLGAIWLAISVAIDLPLMLSPPISMPPLEYAADIGLTYLMIPVITVGIAVAQTNRAITGR
ncbi:MAG TPA: hypothetical protein VFV87_12320 [Pirellulaceae bacterium]|nr:hypothetical protein [Pirellulaceae bacterium]